MRQRMTAFLRQEFPGDLVFNSLDVSMFPWVRVTATGLVVHHHGRTDIPALLQIEKLSAEAGFLGLLRHPPHLGSVRLEGLKIRIPPRRNGAQPASRDVQQPALENLGLVVEEVLAEGAELEILRRDPRKHSDVFLIHQVELRGVRLDHASQFRAMLTCPAPKGEITASGEFGPWQPDEPSLTPVKADYALTKADLSTLVGLPGTLSSKGNFSGPLDYLSVRGQTETPDFRVQPKGQPLRLNTDFEGIIDGTNGNIVLKNVSARFLRSSAVASGKILQSSEAKRRMVLLDIVSKDARVEDLLRLALAGEQPLMTGPASLRVRLELPPGDGDILNRLKLQGEFGVESARFSSPEVQEQVNTLSRKGQGVPPETELGTALAKLSGSLTLTGGVMHFSDLKFDVSGASILMAGHYDLKSEQLDFRGTLRLQAKLSQTTTGAKSFFLKGLDPFFKGKNAGSVLPIKITGTREKPSFGLDLGHSAETKP